MNAQDNDTPMLDSFKIAQWLVAPDRQDELVRIAELIPIELCSSHDEGGETCWGQDGHIWEGPSSGPMLCHPRAGEVFGVDPSLLD